MTEIKLDRRQVHQQLLEETRGLMLSSDIHWLKFYQGEDSNSVRDWEYRVFDAPYLHLAAHEGNYENVKSLIKKNENVNQRIIDGPKLMRTSSKYAKEYVGFFRGTTPLMMAAQAGHLKIVKYLLRHNANVKITDSLGITAFTWACVSGNIDICQLLLLNGANIDRRDSRFGMTPLLLAAQRNHTKVVKWLVKMGADIHKKSKHKGQNVLHIASFNSNVKLIKCFVKRGLNTNEQDHSGNTPLHMLLSNLELDLDIEDSPWSTKEERQLQNIFRLMDRNKYGEIDIQRETRACASWTIPPNDGWYALKALLDLGANLNIQNKEGRSPLLTLVSHLPEAVCSQGYVITKNICRNQFLVVQMLILLKSGADPSLFDTNNRTALDYCHDVNNMAAIKILNRFSDEQNIEIENVDSWREEGGFEYSQKEKDFEDNVQWISRAVCEGQVSGFRAMIPTREQRHRLRLQIRDWIENNWAPGDL